MNLTPTHFLSAENIAEIIRKEGLDNCLKGIAGYIEQDFLRWQEFEKSARVANHSTDGVIELMPISDHDLYSFKYVNGHPKNTQLGLSTVMAFGVLADVATGTPQLLSELTLTTALRTAAMSALAAKKLARPDSKRMALIGNGAQSDFQAIAFYALLGIDELRLYDTDHSASEKLVSNLAAWPIKTTICNSAKEAAVGVDIITTVTADKAYATIVTPDMVRAGMHINGVGGDCPGKTELHKDVLSPARVFVEFEPQSRIEGDIQQMPADFAVTEFWKVLRGEAAGRTTSDQITVFDSVGFALEDYSALRYVRDSALKYGLGRPISLIPALANPKDLYSLIGNTARSNYPLPPQIQNIPVAA